jgi:hypothetical protein
LVSVIPVRWFACVRSFANRRSCECVSVQESVCVIAWVCVTVIVWAGRWGWVILSAGARVCA